MREFFRDVIEWLRLVISGWRQYAEAGGTALIWALIERIRRKPVSWHVLELAGVAFLIFAFFNVWRDETKRHRETIQKLRGASPQIQEYIELSKEKKCLQDELADLEAGLKHSEHWNRIMPFPFALDKPGAFRAKIELRKEAIKAIDERLKTKS